MGADVGAARHQRDQGIGVGEPDGELVVVGVVGRAEVLDGRHLHDDGGDRDLDGGDGDLVGGLEVADRIEVGCAGVEIHRDRCHGRHALDVGVAPRAVPQREEGRRSRADDVGRARQQQVVDEGGAPELDPFDLQIGDAALARVALDQALLLHDQQGQEADPAGSARDLDHVGLGQRQRRPQQRGSAKQGKASTHHLPFLPCAAPLRSGGAARGRIMGEAPGKRKRRTARKGSKASSESNRRRASHGRR